jgi:anti-anti-sigma factor
MLNCTVTDSGSSSCISLHGRIDGLTSSDIERQMKELLLQGKRNLIVDFAQINYISSAGLRVFLMIQKQLKQAGGEIILAALPAAVMEVFRVSGFAKVFRIAKSKEAAETLLGSIAPTIDSIYKVINNVTLVHQKRADTPPGSLISIGNPDKLSHAEFEEQDVVSVNSSEITFGTGLATVGDTFSDFKDFFGEAVIINNNIFFYPAAKRPVVDFMMYAGEQSQFIYRFFHGFGFRGSFAHLVSFDGGNSVVELSNLRTTLLSLTNAKVAGIVLLAESKGIWGMHLKQVPMVDRKPINGEDIFKTTNFSQWMNFPVEPADMNHIVAAVGIAAQDGTVLDPVLRKILGGNELGHFHACIFQKDILSKKPEHFDSELKRVTSELTPLKVQHLLGQSTFSSGLVGIVEMDENIGIKV